MYGSQRWQARETQQRRAFFGVGGEQLCLSLGWSCGTRQGQSRTLSGGPVLSAPRAGRAADLAATCLSPCLSHFTWKPILKPQGSPQSWRLGRRHLECCLPSVSDSLSPSRKVQGAAVGGIPTVCKGAEPWRGLYSMERGLGSG